jgi:hypothetical protein
MSTVPPLYSTQVFKYSPVFTWGPESEQLPKRSWVMGRSSTKASDTGPFTFASSRDHTTVTSQFDVPTSLTPVLSHLFRFHCVGCVKEVSNLINHPVVQVQRWSPSVSIWNFLQPQAESGKSARAGILTPTQEAKNVCQRLTDQVSFLPRWWVLIWPNQLMGLYQRTRLRGILFFWF